MPRYKHSAVDRNRLKRRLRELVRIELLGELPPMDVVLRVAPHAYGRTFDSLRDDVRKAGRQLVKLELGDVPMTQRPPSAT